MKWGAAVGDKAEGDKAAVAGKPAGGDGEAEGVKSR